MPSSALLPGVFQRKIQRKAMAASKKIVYHAYKVFALKFRHIVCCLPSIEIGIDCFCYKSHSRGEFSR